MTVGAIIVRRAVDAFIEEYGQRPSAPTVEAVEDALLGGYTDVDDYIADTWETQDDARDMGVDIDAARELWEIIDAEADE